jgi:hypothetical protein
MKQEIRKNPEKCEVKPKQYCMYLWGKAKNINGERGVRDKGRNRAYK